LAGISKTEGYIMIKLDFGKQGGLIPVIAQDYQSGEVLMLAFMNQEAWDLTVKTGIVHYWSRSRGSIWKKGESSGNIQEVKEIRVDCDNDTLLIKVDQIGRAACHEGYRSCFYRVLKNDDCVIDGERIFDPKEVYGAKK
jgi:phosphoribosyl-AMP cyclohydrolase